MQIIFADVIKLTRGQPQLGWALIHYYWFLYKKTETQGAECPVKTQTLGRPLCVDGGRDRSFFVTSQGMPGAIRS